MNRLPTLAHLERAGTDASKLLESYIDEARNMASLGATAADREADRQRLDAANRCWNEWLGDEPAGAGEVTR